MLFHRIKCLLRINSLSNTKLKFRAILKPIALKRLYRSFLKNIVIKSNRVFTQILQMGNFYHVKFHPLQFLFIRLAAVHFSSCVAAREYVSTNPSPGISTSSHLDETTDVHLNIDGYRMMKSCPADVGEYAAVTLNFSCSSSCP